MTEQPSVVSKDFAELYFAKPCTGEKDNLKIDASCSMSWKRRSVKPSIKSTSDEDEEGKYHDMPIF